MPVPIHILVVDDRPENLLVMEGLLESPDFKIVTASSGNQALGLMLEHNFALVLLDVQMPGMDGFETAELMRSNPRTKDTPIIFVTAISKDRKHVFKGYEAGAVDYLFKPVDPGILQTKVHIFCDLFRAKTQAEANRKLLETMLYCIGDGIIATDTDDLITMMNQQAAGITGWKEKDALGRKLLEVFNARGEHCQTMSELHAQAGPRTSDTPVKTVGRLVSLNGTFMPVEFNATPIVDANGKTHGRIVTFNDISARKQAEEKLLGREEHIRLLLNSTVEAIYGLDMDGNCTFCNPACLSYLGYREPGDLLGKNIHNLIHHTRPNGEKYDIKECPVYKSFLDQHEIHVADEVLWKADGTCLPVEYRSHPVVKNGVVTGAVVTFTDISYRRQAEEEKTRLQTQLRQAQKMEAIGTLAGGIAHDFNNILTPIVGYSELTMAQLDKDSDLHRNLEELLKAAYRARDLVKQILTFSRQKEKELVPLQIQPIIKEALKLLRSTLPSTIEFRQHIDTTVGPVRADPTQIHQILMNLCTNAYHAMREQGGILEVSLRQLALTDNHMLPAGKYLQLVVSDSGCGMDTKTMERIFEPYFTTKDVGKGTGMGLAVVHGIVQNHQGRITVESEVNKGSIFTVTIPLSDVTIPTMNSATTSTLELTKGNENILLVDDEPQIAQMTGKMVEKLGYKAKVFTDSQVALAAFKDTPEAFDLVITDQTMPGLTGVNLAHEILVIRPDMPIILCTGYSEIVSEENAKTLGIGRYLNKPIIMTDLARAINEILTTRLRKN